MQLILHLARLFCRGTALALVLLAFGLGLLGLGGAFSDRLDVPNHFAPIWLLLGLAGGLLGAIVSRRSERWAIVAMGVVAILAHGGLMAPELIAAQTRKLDPGPATLKVMQFNVWSENDDPADALKWILAEDPDVLFIEEGGGNSWALIGPLRRLYPFVVSCSGAARPCDSWVFSKKRMIARGGVYDHERPMSAAWATLADPNGPFTVVATHYIWPIPAGAQQAQSRRLAEMLNGFDKKAMIVAGDFNSTPWSWSLRRQDKLFGLQRRTLALPSWPSGAFIRLLKAPFPFMPIDHVYAGKEWNTVSVRRGPHLGSDHRPVVVTLKRG
jgi:endonuclease/exonuclease/phosphatase (EEP) superfamily protein YafD